MSIFALSHVQNVYSDDFFFFVLLTYFFFNVEDVYEHINNIQLQPFSTVFSLAITVRAALLDIRVSVRNTSANADCKGR